MFASFEGDTPLHIAAREERSDICRLILESVEDRETLNCRNEDGETALDVAMDTGHRNQEVVEMLERFRVVNSIPEIRNAYRQHYQD